MQDAIIIRDETPQDYAAITAITRAAFATLAISQKNEHHIITALRQAGALAASLVAEKRGKVVGHIAFSPALISDGAQGWYALGPLAVDPSLQKQGIGSLLVKTGLKRLQEMNACGCCLVGHPKYYVKFGFSNSKDLIYPGVPAQVFFVMSFTPSAPHGTVSFHPAFMSEGN